MAEEREKIEADDVVSEVAGDVADTKAAVGGTVVVDDGKIVSNVYPGRALRGPGARNLE